MIPRPASDRSALWRLFALSFMGLFLELMLIRWAPSAVRLVSYYANLLLLSSFFGLGAGALLAAKGPRLFRWFPVLLGFDLLFLLSSKEVGLGGGGLEMRFFYAKAHWLNPVILVSLFLLNALVFVPIGQRLGELFSALTNLRAYAWDLAGSLLGSVAFGLFSFFHFSPSLGFGFVAVLHCVQVHRRQLVLLAPLWAVLVLVVALHSPSGALWSPYHYITVSEMGHSGLVVEGPEGLRTMRNPPAYQVSVNFDFYQLNLSQDLSRYDKGHPGLRMVDIQRGQYDVPYALSAERRRVLVLGSGGGADVQGALRHGVAHIDAVDIDERLIGLSKRLNPDAPYDDPRVQVHVDDARSYIAKAEKGYDLVVFGFLDSQALFSSMSNVRIDGYVYTVEGLRAAYRLLNSKGMLSLSFVASNDWLALKLYRSLEAATGAPVAAYMRGRQVVLCVGPGLAPELPDSVGEFRRVRQIVGEIPLATDDWPFLYLAGKGVPSDYAVVIGALMLLSVLAILLIRGRRGFGLQDGAFAALGVGFMLLETKSVGDCALYFGNTWFVTMLVVCGVLLMVLLANAIASRLGLFRPSYFVPLLVSLVFLWLVPREWVLEQEFVGRLLWSLLVMPLPVFFAGLIFSTLFRDVKDSAGAFGANLLGAMLGGFGEYLSMVSGNRSLSLLVMGAYLTCYLLLALGRKR